MIPCLICKTPFTPLKRNGLNFSRLCSECRKEVQSAKRRIKEAKAQITPEERVDKTLREMSHPDLKKLAQKEFNEYIRNRDRLPSDMFYCPTCKKFKHIKEGNYHACHFYPTTYTALRFNENNVFGGCSACNLFKHGVGHEYGEWVREKLGEVEFNRLKEIQEEWQRDGSQWDRFALMEVIVKYKTLNKQCHERL